MAKFTISGYTWYEGDDGNFYTRKQWVWRGVKLVLFGLVVYLVIALFMATLIHASADSGFSPDQGRWTNTRQENLDAGFASPRGRG